MVWLIWTKNDKSQAFKKNKTKQISRVYGQSLLVDSGGRSMCLYPGNKWSTSLQGLSRLFQPHTYYLSAL
jgi:hypothetical protein